MKPLPEINTPLTEKEAWLFLAECWDELEHKAMFSYSTPWARGFGLCNGLAELRAGENITEEIHNSVLDKIYDYATKNKKHGAYLFPLDLSGAKMRAQFCRERAGEL